METAKNKFIVATYAMYDATGENEILIEETTVAHPMIVISGFGMSAIKPLEDHLVTLSSGDDYSITINPEDAFGPHHAEMVIDADRAMFLVDGTFDEEHVKVGAILPMQNEQGQRFLATVVNIGEEKVTLDFNHPLAGRTLKIVGSVIDIHDATEDEIKELTTPHGHCSGNCGDCGDSKGCKGEHKNGEECHCAEGECNCAQ